MIPACHLHITSGLLLGLLKCQWHLKIPLEYSQPLGIFYTCRECHCFIQCPLAVNKFVKHLCFHFDFEFIRMSLDNQQPYGDFFFFKQWNSRQHMLKTIQHLYDLNLLVFFVPCFRVGKDGEDYSVYLCLSGMFACLAFSNCVY